MNKEKEYLLYLYSVGYRHLSVDEMASLKSDICASNKSLLSGYCVLWEKKLKELEPMSFKSWDREAKFKDILDG